MQSIVCPMIEENNFQMNHFHFSSSTARVACGCLVMMKIILKAVNANWHFCPSVHVTVSGAEVACLSYIYIILLS